MARLEGITGGLSGKMGSAVFRQSGGKTIASQYQPIVKNPNSEGQQSARAAFKLMSQLAAVMKDGFGTMGINDRPARARMSQRNAFFKLNYELIQITENSDGVTATIPMEELKLTSSTRILGSLTQLGDTVSCGVLDSSITSVRFVLVSYIDDDVTRPVVSSVNVVSVNNGVASLEGIPQGKYTVLAYGLIPTASASSATLDNLHTPTNQDYFAAIKLDSLVASGQIVETTTKGINIDVVL